MVSRCHCCAICSVVLCWIMILWTTPHCVMSFDLVVQKKPGVTKASQIARFMGPSWGPSGADRTQVGPMLASWTLLSGFVSTKWLNVEWLRKTVKLNHSLTQKYLLYPLKYVHIWQVSLQLSCNSTFEIWTWYLIGNKCYDYSEKLEK